jgi:hypothetical protein
VQERVAQHLELPHEPVARVDLHAAVTAVLAVDGRRRDGRGRAHRGLQVRELRRVGIERRAVDHLGCDGQPREHRRRLERGPPPRREQRVRVLPHVARSLRRDEQRTCGTGGDATVVDTTDRTAHVRER